MKGQKSYKSELVTKFVTKLFSYKHLSQIPYKIFATQCFSTDHLKRKIVNKITFRTPSANPRQLCAN